MSEPLTLLLVWLLGISLAGWIGFVICMSFKTHCIYTGYVVANTLCTAAVEIGHGNCYSPTYDTVYLTKGIYSANTEQAAHVAAHEAAHAYQNKHFSECFWCLPYVVMLVTFFCLMGYAVPITQPAAVCLIVLSVYYRMLIEVQAWMFAVCRLKVLGITPNWPLILTSILSYA